MEKNRIKRQTILPFRECQMALDGDPATEKERLEKMIATYEKEKELAKKSKYYTERMKQKYNDEVLKNIMDVDGYATAQSDHAVYYSESGRNPNYYLYEGTELDTDNGMDPKYYKGANTK